MIIVDAMKLAVYRSCTREEKREVLDVFWRSSPHPSPKIDEAARQYGPYAILCIVVIALELALVVFVSIHRGYVWGWFAGLLEALSIASLWWSVVRYRVLRS